MQYIEPIFQIVSTVMMLVFGLYFLCRSFNQSVKNAADKKRSSDRTQYRIDDLEDEVFDIKEKLMELRLDLLSLADRYAEKSKESPFPALLSSLLGMISKLGDLASSDKSAEDEVEIRKEDTQVSTEFGFKNKE